MDSEIVLVSTMEGENQELVEVPMSMFDSESVVIDTGTFEMTSSIDLETEVMETEVIETSTLELINEHSDNSQGHLQAEQLYAVVCTGPNGEIVEEVTVEDDNESVIQYTVDDALHVPSSNVVDEVTDESVAESVNESETEILSEQINEPIEETLTETVEEVINEVTDHPIDEIIHQSVIGMPDQSTIEIADQSVIEIASESAIEMVDGSVIEIADEPVIEIADEPVIEIAGQQIIDITDQSVNESVDESICESVEVAASEPVEITISEQVEETVTSDETVKEMKSECIEEFYVASETMESINAPLESSNVQMESKSIEMTDDSVDSKSDAEMETELVTETVIETAEEKCSVLISELSSSSETAEEKDSKVETDDVKVEKSDNQIKLKLSDNNLDDTVTSAGEADATLDTTDTAVKSPPERDGGEESNFIIDTSRPIELKVGTVMWISGHKCIIQNHPDKSGELVAYPVKERNRKRKARGRPRKPKPPSVVDEEEEIEEKPKPVVEDKTEKGFVQMADASGTVVKRSARKRKRASHLDEYETGMVGATSDNEEQSVAEEDDDYNKLKNNTGYSFRGRGVRGRGRGRGSPQIANGGRGRGRGRPRRYNIEPDTLEEPKPKPPKPPSQPQQQAYLVQMADGRTVVIQVPVTGLAEGMTSQSLAMSVAEALSSGQSSGVLNISVQRGSGSAVTTEKIEIKKDGKVEEQKKPERTSTTISSASAVTTPQPTLIPLTVVPSKVESNVQIGVKTSEADLAKLRCSKCEFQGFYLQQLQEHLMAAHVEALTRCKACPYVTLQKTDLIDHFKEKHPKCLCTVCNFMVDQPYAMRVHMQRHVTTGTTCHICGKNYKDRYILRIHMKMVHMPAKVLFECPLCTKKFSRKAHLVRHLRTHNPAKPFKCSKCDYRGSEKSDLTKHSLIHEEPKHSCEICGHSFRHLRNKEIHLKRHAGQKDYKCGVCDFLGYTFTEIRKHIARKHASDPNTRMCLKCGQAFLTDIQLTDHQLNGTCEIYSQEEALLATEELSFEEESEMEVESVNSNINGEPPSIHLSEDALSVVVNSSELMDVKEDNDAEETLASENVDVNCEPQTISLVSDGVEFDGSHGLLTLLSEDGQVIRGIILDSGEIETQVENAVVLEEVT